MQLCLPRFDVPPGIVPFGANPGELCPDKAWRSPYLIRFHSHASCLNASQPECHLPATPTSISRVQCMGASKACGKTRFAHDLSLISDRVLRPACSCLATDMIIVTPCVCCRSVKPANFLGRGQKGVVLVDFGRAELAAQPEDLLYEEDNPMFRPRMRVQQQRPRPPMARMSAIARMSPSMVSGTRSDRGVRPAMPRRMHSIHPRRCFGTAPRLLNPRLPNASLNRLK